MASGLLVVAFAPTVFAAAIFGTSLAQDHSDARLFVVIFVGGSTLGMCASLVTALVTAPFVGRLERLACRCGCGCGCGLASLAVFWYLGPVVVFVFAYLVAAAW